MLRPFEIAANRVARPFRDAANWTHGIFNAKSENEKLRKRNAALQREVATLEGAKQENLLLQKELNFAQGPRFPKDYDEVGARVLTSPSTLAQSVTISAGSEQGIAKEDVVITNQGLVGTVTKVLGNESQVMLITDQESSVRAVDAKSLPAVGILDHGSGATSLVLDGVGKDKSVSVGDLVITAGSQSGSKLASLYPRGIPVGFISSVSQADTDVYKQIEVQPLVDLSSLESVLVLVPKEPGEVVSSTLDVVKAVAFLFIAVLIEVSVIGAYTPLGGTADLVLVVLISIALLRGSVFGAFAGFGAGLLIDTANLTTLGFTSLLLTLAGFWTGRYGETTARDRFHAPFLAVAVITVLYAFGTLALNAVLGEPAPADAYLSGLPATVLLNLVLTWPVYSLMRRVFPPVDVFDRVHDVRLLG